MSNSVFDQKIKRIAFNKLSETEKTVQRTKILNEIFLQLSNKENRYIFYCPDIALVNNLVKLIYETAYECKKMGFNVLILHEINGFKCKWLFEKYKHLSDLSVEYIIKKKSAKSNKTKSNYSFKPSDTLIIPDHFQEMLDNLMDVKLIQKVVYVSSYTGLSSLNPGVDYNSLGVSKAIFTEQKLLDDYTSLFNIESVSLVNPPVNKEIFNNDIREVSEIFPTVCLSNIGSNDYTQQVINIFYNKYPQLRIFSFKILPRDNFEYYLNTLKHAALMVVLDKNLGNTQLITEALACGIPVFSFQRRELEDKKFKEIIAGTNPFEIAHNIALFCQQWLNFSTTLFTDGVNNITNDLSEHNYETFHKELLDVMNYLQENRVKYFTSIKQSIDSIEAQQLLQTV